MVMVGGATVVGVVMGVVVVGAVEAVVDMGAAEAGTAEVVVAAPWLVLPHPDAPIDSTATAANAATIPALFIRSTRSVAGVEGLRLRGAWSNSQPLLAATRAPERL